MIIASRTAYKPDPPPDPSDDMGRLFELHADELHRYLARRTGCAADDLVGDTFVAALGSRGTFDARRGTQRAWLYGIATNLANNHLRRRARENAAVGRAAETDHADGPESRVVDRVDAQVRAAQLARAIAALPDADRDVLLLSSWSGLTQQEVADALGIPAGTVRSRLHRVRRQLRSAAPQITVEEDIRVDR
ncbi:RNA polymerase sigma factor [Actinoplanes siamensis]|uniref:DNA-directed RNA polymerase sigma-70 factor n=1 Tax=Actinoplanes siamensis TaxID=1223317 RepID=A0A919NC91_9ACTN|nr:RNA polymerase sigma factor [Actinoplanes siamensis]GIF08539.1 DNA-directed RNA polymerase sigma-70 factor [Actinoplanes siamensis]